MANVVACETECCCTLDISLMIFTGATAYPRRHPVIAYAFEKPLMVIVRSAMSPMAASEMCSFPYTSFSYISSDIA